MVGSFCDPGGHLPVRFFVHYLLTQSDSFVRKGRFLDAHTNSQQAQDKAQELY